jgi:dTDP-4-dehydrorhamnose 3,5-epimerase-like enzyme
LTQLPVHDCQILTLAVQSDDRGSLVSLEPETGVPFEIKRTFYIYSTPEGAARGAHAHLNFEELLVCVAGSCVVTVDDGRESAEVRLDSPAKALVIGTMVWTEIRDFTPGAVLLALASRPHGESEYIRDYDRFLEVANA